MVHEMGLAGLLLWEDPNPAQGQGRAGAISEHRAISGAGVGAPRAHPAAALPALALCCSCPQQSSLQLRQEGSPETPATVGMKSSRKLLEEGRKKEEKAFQAFVNHWADRSPSKREGKSPSKGDPVPLTLTQCGAAAASVHLQPDALRCTERSCFEALFINRACMC